MADVIHDDEMLNAALAHLARTWRAEAVKADALSEKRPHPADVMLSARAQSYSDCASALEAALRPPGPVDGRTESAAASLPVSSGPATGTERAAAMTDPEIARKHARGDFIARAHSRCADIIPCGLDYAQRSRLTDVLSGVWDDGCRYRPDAITEHAIEMSSGDMKVRNPDPEIECAYPLDEWITHNQRFGGKVWKRRVIVLEDWEEVPRA